MTIKKLALPVAALALLALAAGTRADPVAGTGSVSGVVHGLDGKPVANAKVSLVPYDSVKKTAEDKKKDKAAALQGTTDADGKFKIDSVPAGPYNIRANLKGVGSVKSQLTVKAGEDFPITLQLHAVKKKS